MPIKKAPGLFWGRVRGSSNLIRLSQSTHRKSNQRLSSKIQKYNNMKYQPYLLHNTTKNLNN